MKKLVKALLVVTLLLFVSPSRVSAKRFVPQAKRPSGGGTQVVNTKGITSSVRFRADRRAIVVNFSNLSIAKSVSYSLIYDVQGITQGANGSVALAPSPVTREIIFGSCSTNNVCRYDTGVKNAKFVLTTTLKTGKRVVKTYRLKV